MTDKVVELSTTSSDREIAADLRGRIDMHLNALVHIMNEANFAGLQVSFSLSRDQMGRNRVQDVTIFRPL